MEGRRFRPAIEALERRDCPSVTAGVNAGNLIVNATTATSNLTISETSSGSFQIGLNGQALGAFSGVSGGLDLKLSNQDNIGTLINLGGFASLDSVLVSLGNGADSLTIENGGIQGPLTIKGGRGNDQVTLGGGSNPLNIGGATDVKLGASTADTLTLNSGVSIVRDLTASSADHFNMLAGSLVGGNLKLSGGNGAWALLNGQVAHNAAFTGTAGADNFTLGSSGSIGHDLTIRSRGGDDTLNIQGKVGHDLDIYSQGWGGAKTVQFTGQVGHNANILLGHGGNSVDLNGSVQRKLLVNSNGGADVVNADSNLSVKNLTVNLGGDDDTLMWNGGASVSGIARLRGDGNSTSSPGDTFVTDLTMLPAHLRLSGFETKDLGA